MNSYSDSRSMDWKSIVCKGKAMDKCKHGEWNGTVDVSTVTGT